MAVRVVVSDKVAFGDHAEKIKSEVSLGYGSDISSQIEIRYDFGLTADIEYARQIGAIAVLDSTNLVGPSNGISAALGVYPYIQVFMPLGSNSYVELSTPKPIPVIVTSGSGDTQNRTAYGEGLEFWDIEQQDAGFESSYSNGTVAGKLLKIRDALGCSWWEARCRARKSTGQGWSKFNGWGKIDVNAAIAFSGGIDADYYPLRSNAWLSGIL